jgi:hypothetical protein
MERSADDATTEVTDGRKAPRTKKAQIVALYVNGVTDVEELADLTESRSSYVASVLQESGLLTGYFDLYTHSAHPMNIYSKIFSERLGFKDEASARAGVELLESHYSQFEQERDRAGQHHALTLALTMFDRARWSGKVIEAEVYRQWLTSKLSLGVGSEELKSSHPLDQDPPRH